MSIRLDAPSCSQLKMLQDLLPASLNKYLLEAAESISSAAVAKHAIFGEAMSLSLELKSMIVLSK